VQRLVGGRMILSSHAIIWENSSTLPHG